MGIAATRIDGDQTAQAGASGKTALRALTDEFQASGSIDLARLAIVNRQMTSLIGLSGATAPR